MGTALIVHRDDAARHVCGETASESGVSLAKMSNLRKESVAELGVRGVERRWGHTLPLGSADSQVA